MLTDSEKIIESARKLLGTPYKHQGRLPGIALDCIGLPICIAKELGYEYLDLTAYGRIPHKGLLDEMVAKQPCLYRVYDRQPGDLFLMKYVADPQHVAIFTGDSIIHCSSLTDRVVEHRIDEETERQIVSTYRFKKPDQSNQ